MNAYYYSQIMHYTFACLSLFVVLCVCDYVFIDFKYYFLRFIVHCQDNV